MVHLAQLAGRADAKGPYEVRHIEPVGATGACALLLGKPNLFFGNRRECGDGRKARHVRLDDGNFGFGHAVPCPAYIFVINWIITKIQGLR